MADNHLDDRSLPGDSNTESDGQSDSHTNPIGISNPNRYADTTTSYPDSDTNYDPDANANCDANARPNLHGDVRQPGGDHDCGHAAGDALPIEHPGVGYW